MGQRTYMQVLRRSTSAIPVGVVRASGAPAGDLPVFQTLEKALTELSPDLTIVSTPHYLHFEHVSMALARGSHVLVDKPLTLDLARSEQLVRLAQEKNRLLVVGLQRRYEGFASVCRELVAEGGLAQMRFIHGLFAHRFSGSGPGGWRADPAKAGDGILDDSAWHLIDLLTFLATGTAVRVQSRLMRDGQGLPAHSFAAVIEMSTGVVVSASGSYMSPTNSVQEEVSVFGTRGSVFARRFCRDWDDRPPDVFFKTSDGSRNITFDLCSRPAGRSLPLLALLSFIAGESPRQALLTEAKDVLETHRIVDRIRRQVQ
jgi:predicted dehydrogenase